ncbi:hypothetical protein LguiA_021096 [Lonicera macranthoides]
MAKSSADGKVLSYNDVVLRRSDPTILSSPLFLNDRIIEFYFSYLTSCHPSEFILLVLPSISFWVTNCPDLESIKDFLQPLNFPRKKLVIFPINDNDDVEKAEGGSHWGLLAFYRGKNVFVHHDSFGGSNKRYAKRLYEALVPYMGILNGAYVECSNTPQQMNGYDCGLYVLTIARAICCVYEREGPKDEEDLWFTYVKEQVSPLVVFGLRNEILGLIRSLRAM